MLVLDSHKRDKLIRWVISNQSREFGFSFSNLLPPLSSATFYAISILKLLQAEIPNRDKNIKYLLDLSNDGSNVYSAYHSAKALSLFNLSPKNPSDMIKSVLEQLERWEKIRNRTYYESPLETVHYSVEILRLLNCKGLSHKIPEMILKFLNDDGGFGSDNHSEIETTYFALASLNSIGYPLKNDLEKTMCFVEKCQNPNHGFASVPNAYSTFIEDTYYGIKSLSFFGEKINKPKETLEFVLRCQNSDGGFSRSESGGISTLENCFYAIHIMNYLSI